jgi:hypothetical protein
MASARSESASKPRLSARRARASDGSRPVGGDLGEVGVGGFENRPLVRERRWGYQDHVAGPLDGLSEAIVPSVHRVERGIEVPEVHVESDGGGARRGDGVDQVGEDRTWKG